MSGYTVTVPSCQIAGLADLLLEHLGYIEHGRLVEVGAFDGYGYSNTWDLLRLGWSGLLVEPHPEHYRALRARYATFPGVTTVKAALADYDGRADLYLKGPLSSLLPDATARVASVRVLTLGSLLARYGWAPGFDLLVVDTEGTELKVLRGLDLTYWRPRLLIIETNRCYGPEQGDALDRFLAPGYRPVHVDGINTVYAGGGR